MLATLLPWTTSFGTNYAGYQAYAPVDMNYDGFAGQINLLMSLVLLAFGYLVLFGRPVKFVLAFYQLLLLSWNVVLLVWLVTIFRELDFLTKYGLYVAGFVSNGAAICILIAMFAADPEESYVEPSDRNSRRKH